MSRCAQIAGLVRVEEGAVARRTRPDFAIRGACVVVCLLCLSAGRGASESGWVSTNAESARLEPGQWVPSAREGVAGLSVDDLEKVDLGGIGSEEGCWLRDVEYRGIRGMAEEANGDMWLVSPAGANRLSGTEARLYRVFRLFGDTSPENRARPVLARGGHCLIDDEGTLWVAAHGGVLRCASGAFAFIRIGIARRNNQPSCSVLHLADDGFLFAGGSSQEVVALRRRNNDLFRLHYANDVADQVMSFVADERDGSLWVLMARSGIWRYRVREGDLPGPSEWRQWNNPEEGWRFRALAIDARGRLWLGRNSGLWVGAAKGNSAQWLQVAPDRLKSVAAIAVDAQDRVWVGTAEGEVFTISESGIQLLHRAEGDAVISIFMDSNERVWVSHAFGLYVNSVDALLAQGAAILEESPGDDSARNTQAPDGSAESERKIAHE